MPQIGIDSGNQKNNTQTESKTDPDSQWAQSPPQEKRVRSDSGYGSSPEDKSLQIRDIASETVKAQPSLDVGRSYLTDLKQFDKSLFAMNEALTHCHTKRSHSQLPFWIQSDRYPVRQFRAYYLLELDKQDPISHEKLQARMSDLEQKFMQHKEDLISKTLPRRYVIPSDLFNSLAAIQAFLGKTAEAEKTIQQGFDFEPGNIIFSLQDARYDLRITDKQVLQGFPQKLS